MPDGEAAAPDAGVRVRGPAEGAGLPGGPVPGVTGAGNPEGIVAFMFEQKFTIVTFPQPTGHHGPDHGRRCDALRGLEPPQLPGGRRAHGQAHHERGQEVQGAGERQRHGKDTVLAVVT